MRPHTLRVIESGAAAPDEDAVAPAHVGAFLREARLSTGRDLADIAASLRIRAKFLQAIEDGRYEDLPGATYATGFIRSYADFLGLDAKALLAQFKIESNNKEHPDLEFPAPSTVGWFPTGKVVATCAVLAAAIFGGWYYSQTKNSVDVATVPQVPGGTTSLAARASTEPPAGTAAVASPDPAFESEEPYSLPVPITGLVAVDPVATEADLSPPEPAEAAPATAATAVNEQPLTAERAPAPPATTTPPTPEAVAAAAPTIVVAPPPPVPAPPSLTAPAPPIQSNALASASEPREPAADRGDGRTYGVVNQAARVVIGARADSWVQVLDSNQNVLLTRMLRPGDRYLVPDRSDLVMLTGNAGGLIISVDGVQVPQIGSDGAILHNVRLDVDLLKAGRAVIQ